MISAAKKPGIFYGYVIVAAVFVMMVALWGTYFTFGVFFESLSKEYSWSRAVTSGAIAANSILLGLSAIPVSRLSDRYGPQLTFGLCGVILSAGYFLMSRASTGWQLYVFYVVLVAIGMGICTALLPIVARWFVKRRALMTAVVFCGMGVGMMVIPPLMSQLILLKGWRFSYMIVGIIALVGGAGGAQFLRRDPAKLGQRPYGGDENEATDLAHATGVSFSEAMHTRQFWLVSAIYFIFLFSQLTINVHIVVHAIRALSISEVSAATVFSYIGFALILGMLVMGVVAHRFSNKRAFVVSFTILILSFVWLLMTKELWMLYLFGVLVGFSWGGMQILYAPITAELFGLKSHGVILTTAAFIGGLGAAIGPWLTGVIYDTNSSYGPAFIICAALAAMGLTMAISLGTLHRKEAEKLI